MYREIPARVVAEVAETSPDYLRNFRSDGLIPDGVGEKDGAGYLYARSECLSISVAVQLSKAGLGVKGAFDAVFANPVPGLVEAIAGHGGTATFWPPRSSGLLATTVKIVVDLGALVRDAQMRLDVALEKEQRRVGNGRRLSFSSSPPPMTSNSRP